MTKTCIGKIDHVYILNEPRYVKTGFLLMRKQRLRSASQLHREADQRLCFRFIDSTIPQLSKYKISSL